MPTIAATVREVVADISPEEVDLIPTVTRGFYDNGASRKATVESIVLGKSSDAALGFGAIETGQLITSIVVIVLNGVAGNVLTGMTERRLGRFGGWLTRRRLARQLAVAAPAGDAAALPKLTATQAEAVADLVKELARGSGVPTEVGTRLAISVAGKLMASS